MSIAVVLQALGWVSVLTLVSVHVLIQRGRLPEDGKAYRSAGCVAAASVVAAAAAEEIWPVAVLGLLWLRIEVFGHRHRALAVRPAATADHTTDHTAKVSHLPHPPHLPHPHLDRRTVDRVFKVEMGVVILIALVFFGIWARQQETRFDRNTNRVVCSWIEGC